MVGSTGGNNSSLLYSDRYDPEVFSGNDDLDIKDKRLIRGDLKVSNCDDIQNRMKFFNKSWRIVQLLKTMFKSFDPDLNLRVINRRHLHKEFGP